jgi:hypothetical protein
MLMEKKKQLPSISVNTGCKTNKAKEKKAYDNDFLSRKAQGKVSKIYLSSEFNEHHPTGIAKVIQFIENEFNKKGSGGIISAGGSRGKSIIFKCFRHSAHMPLEKKAGNPRDTSTAKPQNKEDTCQWRFTLHIEIKVAMQLERNMLQKSLQQTTNALRLGDDES